MDITADLYPPSVKGVPSDLTVASPNYRRAVVAVFSSLVLFVILYLTLVAAAGWLCYQAVAYPMPDTSRISILLKVGSVAITAMLFAFLVKGLFKRQTHNRDLHLEITEAEHPELFAFVRQLCLETRAPFPYRIFLSPDVNAAVFYNSSILNLLFPVRKNLLIGLGLVNSLDLCEFKAVLAHEFGHFAQSSMRLGSYVYIANRIIADMVLARDSWDDLLERWRRQDIRIAFFGYVLHFIVWVLRGILKGVFRGINFLEAGLSRQMEFHADLVAVSVTGSDSLVHALSRLEFSNDCLTQALQDLKTAADHRLYTRDLYFHQARNTGFLRGVRQDPQAGLPPALPESPAQQVQVFQPGDGGIPSMWASHPSNYDREQNAKRLYFRSVQDRRSPWLLFREPERVREQMTRLLYRSGFDLPEDAALQDPAEVQAFIDEEHAETTYDPRYHGLYDGRYVEPGDVNALVTAVQTSSWPATQLRAVADRLYEGGFREWLERHHERQGEEHLLSQLAQGEWKLKGKTFSFRGGDYRMKDVKQLSEMIERELEEDGKWLERFDAEVLQAHYQMALQALPGAERELWARYLFHLEVQKIFRDVSLQKGRLEALLEYLSAHGRNLEADDFKGVLEVLREVHDALESAHTASQAVGVPALKNLAAGRALSQVLFDKPLPPALAPEENSLRGEWIGEVMQQLHSAQERARRIHFKSLGGILALQERIAAAWSSVASTAPASCVAVEPAEPAVPGELPGS